MTRRGPHEGSIHQRKDGRWVGSVHMGYEPGRRVRKHVFGKTRAEVVVKMKPLLKARDEHRPVPDERLKVGAFLRTWLEDVAKPTIRVSTYESYRSIVEVHLVPGLGHLRLAKLTPADVQTFLTKKHESGLSPRRVQMLHAILRRALRIAEEWGYVSRNVARLVRPPRVPKHEITPLTPGQAAILIRSSEDHRLHALWVSALGTGQRQGELLGLRWEDVEVDQARLTVRHTLQRVGGELVLLEPKTERSRRTIALPEVVMSALRGHRTRQKMERLVAGSRWVDSGHVFTTSRGTPLDAATVTRSFQRALSGAALPHRRFHDLRHSAATFLLAQGFSLEDVKNLLGHSSIVLTSNTYGHVLEGRQRELADGLDTVLTG